MLNDKGFDGLRPDTDVAHLFHCLVRRGKTRHHRANVRR
jgi:hypothetical protein